MHKKCWVEDDDETFLALSVGDDASGYEEEADTVLKRQESDEDPDEVEESRKNSNMERDEDEESEREEDDY